MGPNIGEAVNFATHDWIAHGSDANERYRSFARPAVFSHDRLTFTMAHHSHEQKAYKNCKSLLHELERVVKEELQLRKKLIATGVRDVSKIIKLPKNRLDQLDEESADYDDKRLCHACKHVCFFSAVACECSQSKVSCLRHSHYMCRCPTERRYLMLWSPEAELDDTLKKVRDHCELLKPVVTKQPEEEEVSSGLETLPPTAVGVAKDLETHKGDAIPLDPFTPSALDIIPEKQLSSDKKYSASPPPEVTTDEDKGEDDEKVEIVIDDADDDDDDEIEVVAVRAGPVKSS
jgi:histone demethylase JARID1